MNPIAIIITALCAVLVSMGALSVGMVIGEKMGLNKQVVPYVWTDPDTHQQYITNPSGGIWPRLDDEGKQVKGE